MYLHQSYPLLLHMPTLPIQSKLMSKRPSRFGVIDPTAIRESIFQRPECGAQHAKDREKAGLMISPSFCSIILYNPQVVVQVYQNITTTTAAAVINPQQQQKQQDTNPLPAPPSLFT